jgi:predicted RNase H-like nuclease
VLATLSSSHSSSGHRDVEIRVEVLASFSEAIEPVERGELAAIGVDMPIGLADGPRAADDEARRALGARRATVFPTPVRATLGSRDHADALARSRAACGRGLSVQAFHLLPKIAEVDAAMTPALQDRVFECHPELAFATLAGRVLASSKHTPEGIAERVDLLVDSLGSHLVEDIRDLMTRPPRATSCRAGRDDVVDAIAVALVARRFATGEVERLGDGARDRRGLRMEIVR